MSSPRWIGDPQWFPQEYLTIADVIGSEVADNGSIILVFGNASTGEVFGKGGMVFNSSGIISTPQLPAAQSGNTSCAQAICFVKNDQWIALAFRDVRNQTNNTPTNNGEISISPTGGKSQIYMNNSNQITITNGVNNSNITITIGSDGSMNIANNSGSINLNSGGNLSFNGGGHSVAFADAIFTQLNAISTTLQSLTGQAAFAKPYIPPTSANTLGSTTVSTG